MPERKGKTEGRAALRAVRRESYESFFSPGALAAAGAAISIAFLLQPSLIVKGAMFAAFALASWLAGKRSSPTATLVATAGIIAANLLVRVGKVILVLGPIQVTEQALLDGIEKAITFEGLVYASKAAVLPALRLPGRFGGIMAAAFIYYDRIIEQAGKIRPATLLSDADALMLRVWESAAASPAPEARAKRPRAGYFVLGALVVASFAGLAYSLTAR